MKIENIQLAKAQLVKEINKILKRFLIFFIVTICGIILGALMFFHVEECYFFTPVPTKNNKACNGLCKRTSKINETCSNQTLNKANCQLDIQMYHKWSHFALSVVFTIGRYYDQIDT